MKGLTAKGWRKVVMGDVVREETRRRGLAVDAGSTGAVMKDLRKQLGEAAVAKLCLKKVKELGAERVVVDGIRSMAEVEEFKRDARVLLVAILASPARRYSLLKGRGRSDDPASQDMFVSRDERELGVGISRAIALADEVLSNEHNSPDELSRRLNEVVDRWLASLEA